MGYRRRYYEKDTSWAGGIILFVLLLLLWLIAKIKTLIGSIHISQNLEEFLACVVLVGLIAMITIYIIKKVKRFRQRQNAPYYDEIEEKVKNLSISISNEFELIKILRNMEAKYFEDFVMLLYTLKWYQIIYKSFWTKVGDKREPKGDHGIDIICLKNDKKIYVQIKKYQNRQVEESVVRDFYGTIVDKLREQDEGVIIATSMLSDTALEFALKKHIKVVEYSGLLKEIKELGKEHKQEIEEFLNEYGSANKEFSMYTKTCPRCFAPLVRRKKWSFYGCMSYYRTGCDYIKK